MKKHAYLIMAHNNFYILDKLLKLLDDERNDIYLHIDSKVKTFDFSKVKKIVKKSNLFFTSRTDVRWGDYSQINCEYLLFKEAVKNKYDYYHIMSGVCLPLKNQDYIHDFFDKLKGKEVVQLTTDEFISKRNAYYRISRYHFFQKYAKSKYKIVRIMYNLFQNIFMPIQSILKVDRIKKYNIQIGYGANWVSITHDFVNYILAKENFVKKVFKYSICADELFVQTLLVNSPFKEKVYSKPSENFNGDACLRFIDWDRGNPYVFTSDDYEVLKNSQFLFARKFDEKKDKKIVDMLYKLNKKEKR